jgi:hypothetical protein
MNCDVKRHVILLTAVYAMMPHTRACYGLSTV